MESGVLAWQPSAPQVHLDHGVEVLDRHVEDRAVAHDSGVVDNDVEPTQVVGGLGDHGLGLRGIRHVRVVGMCAAAALGDDVDGQVRIATGTLAGDRTAEVVDDHCGALTGQFHGVSTADAVPSAGDDRNLAVEHSHWFSLIGGTGPGI